jgi:hypothetical protein
LSLNEGEGADDEKSDTNQPSVLDNFFFLPAHCAHLLKNFLSLHQLNAFWQEDEDALDLVVHNKELNVAAVGVAERNHREDANGCWLNRLHLTDKIC